LLANDTYSIHHITEGSGALQHDATHAKWYRYHAASAGRLDILSCVIDGVMKALTGP